MLDEVSLRIVIELCRDGNCSNAKIAKKLNINAATVAKKKKRLIDDGVIKITAFSNPARMGYQVGAFIGLDVDLKKVDSVCTALTENPTINLVVTCFGRFDILLTACFHNLLALQHFIKAELPQINGINRVETLLMSESKKQHHWELPTHGSKSFKPIQLDDIDKIIINELIQHGQPVYSDLAKKIGVSISTVSRRISCLVKEGIIFFRATPNLSKMGYSANALVLVRAELAKVDKICDELAGFPEVYLVIKVMNDFEILFGILSANPETLYEYFKTKIANIDGIMKTETFIRGAFYHFKAASLYIPSIEE